jgi:hypothetical protein
MDHYMADRPHRRLANDIGKLRVDLVGEAHKPLEGILARAHGRRAGVIGLANEAHTFGANADDATDHAVPKAMAKAHMACNNLVLDDRTVVVPSEEALNPIPIADALKARKFEVIRIPYMVPCMAGASFRCAHQPLIRN